jgi:hypothetical protein
MIKRRMELAIHFQDHRLGELIVRKGQITLDRWPFVFERNLGEVLIEGIDKVLERNKMEVLSLKKMKIEGQVGKESLSYQIGTAFIKALKS